MKLLRITDMLKTARSLSGWHFHMLGKGCVFNSHQGKYIILLETGKESLYALFDKKPLSGAKQLADLMYGFLEEKGAGHNPEFEPIFKKATELTKNGVEWHHHHLYPGCRFSKNKSKHWIILEDPKTKKIMAASYNHRPKGDLAAIEKLFYRELE